MRYAYRPQAAIDQNGSLVPGAVGQVFAITDIAHAAPLSVLDSGGSSRTEVRASASGQTELFYLDDIPEVWFKSGNYVSHLYSITGILAAATEAAAAAVTAKTAAQTAQAAAEATIIGTSDWGNIRNRPEAYPPTAHSHMAESITGGTLNQSRLGSGTADSTTFLRGDGTWAQPPAGEGGGPSGPAEWDELVGKPATFSPSDHEHPSSQISDLSTIGRAVVTAADVGGVKTAIGLSNVNNVADADKPISTATAAALAGKAASSHVHALADITGLTTALAARPLVQVTTTGTEPRPSGATTVIWIGGTVRPTAMGSADIWLSES